MTAPPIIIYQMGKVGSSTIVYSLKKAGFVVHHIHYLNFSTLEKIRLASLSKGLPSPTHVTTSQYLIEEGILSRSNCKLITLVRDPISRNISAFFENYKRFVSDTSQLSNITSLIRIFLQEYPHHIPLSWFDGEIKNELKIDVYDFPFPKDEGYLEIINNNYKLLIIKLEIDDEIKQKALSKFLDIDDIPLFRSNVASRKEYSHAYKKFLDHTTLPEDYINKMCNSKYVKHFYTDKEIEKIRLRWRKKI